MNNARLLLDIVGTAVFAISGVLLAGKLRMDSFAFWYWAW
ncbi:TRIC cation channel family protein [Escherichia coli]|nr:TRIC cation channel family protein [Escherichia coli]